MHIISFAEGKDPSFEELHKYLDDHITVDKVRKHIVIIVMQNCNIDNVDMIKTTSF